MPSRTLLAGCIALALPLATPASAADPRTGTTGKAVTDEVTGWCTFAGRTTQDGQLHLHYGGYLVASAAEGRIPAETVLTCTIVSPAQGLPGEAPTLRHSVSVASPGPVAVAAESTPSWPVRPVRICVDGYAVFDPVAPILVDLTEQCRTATL